VRLASCVQDLRLCLVKLANQDWALVGRVEGRDVDHETVSCLCLTHLGNLFVHIVVAAVLLHYSHNLSFEIAFSASVEANSLVQASH
jgi:hypothetical protein